MTNKERAFNLLDYRSVDRLPAVHFGYWNETLIEWAEQGHITMELAKAWYDGGAAELELDKMLGWDFGWYKCSCGATGLFPRFDYKEISTDSEGFVTYLNGDGIIEKKRAGASSIPAEVDYLLKDRDVWEKDFKPKLQYTSDRIPYDYYKGFNAQEVDYPRGLHVGSVLGEIRNMLSMVGLSYTMCDDYELLEEIIDTYAELQFRCAEETLKTGAKFDFAHYWEDICFKNGPLLSPNMFRDLCAKHYKKRNDMIRDYGIKTISLDCDGVIDMLLPIWMENGITAIFPLEVGVWGANIKPFREKYGKTFKAIGGMDKTVLRKDKAAVDAELERLKPLIALGGYIPCPDHRIMPGSKWELVQYYTQEIKKLKY